MGFKVGINLDIISTIIHETRHAKQDSNFWQELSYKQSFLSHTAIASAKTPVSFLKKNVKTRWINTL